MGWITKDGELIHTSALAQQGAAIDVVTAQPAMNLYNVGQKNDQEKVRLDLLPAYPLVCVARVLTSGARKYAAFNWAGGLSWLRCFGAALRHLFAWAAGEDADPETGESHLAHAICELIFLLDYTRSHPELDDRGKGKIAPVLPSDLKMPRKAA